MKTKWMCLFNVLLLTLMTGVQIAWSQLDATNTSDVDGENFFTTSTLISSSEIPLDVVNDKIPLYLGGLFSLGGRSDESGHVPAVDMALDHINQRTDVLREYELRMVWNDTQCYSNLASRMFIDQIINKPQKLLLVGPPCSTDTPNIAEVAHYWNLISISYGAASPVLSDRKQYPYFFRTVTSTNVFFHLIIRLMREFGWKRVATIHASYVSFGVIENFVSLVKQANFTIAASETIAEDPGIPLANIKRHDAKIIYLAMFPDLARKIFCELYKRDMLGSGYVWLVYGWFPDLWWTGEDETLECTLEEMNKAIHSSNILTVRRVQLSAKEDITIAGLMPHQLVSELVERMLLPKYSNYTWIDDAPYSYDAVWAVAMMLDKTAKALEEKTFSNGQKRRLENFTYDDWEMADMFFHNMQQTNFSGMSGHVAFKNGDRLGDTMLGQLQGDTVQNVALYSIEDDSMELIKDMQWQDDYVPIDHTAMVRKHIAISWYGYLAMSITAGVCIVFAGLFLIFNINYRALTIVKMSSPYLNNVIISGSILIYASIIIGGLDTSTVSRDIFRISCQLRTWLLSTGFVLGYGSMFSKTWRVYRVAAIKTPKRMVITDRHLFIMVMAFFCIDVLVLLLWLFMDPIYVETIEVAEKRDPEIPNRRIISYIEHCTSNNHITWLIIICAYKGLLLLFGTWLAWETRKVTIPALNDSKLIGICVYNTVVLCIVGVSVSFLIRHDTTVLFIFTSSTIIVCATLTLMIIFIPKVVSVYKYPDGVTPTSCKSAIVGSGLTKETRTTSINEPDDVMKLRARVNELEKKLKSRADQKRSPGELEEERGHVKEQNEARHYKETTCFGDSLQSENEHTNKEKMGFTDLTTISETNAM